MAIVMNMYWPEVTREQYEQVRREVNWEGDAPQGGKLHVAWFGEDGFHVFDLWESADDFNRFVEQRLQAGVEKAGISSQPQVQMAEAHAIFAPDV